MIGQPLRCDDGTLRLNFRPLKTDGHFSVERYALAVYNEICMALSGLVEDNVKSKNVKMRVAFQFQLFQFQLEK